MAELAKYWNPTPVVTHIVDEGILGNVRTLCGVVIGNGWESGETYDDYQEAADSIGCYSCERIARARAKRKSP